MGWYCILEVTELLGHNIRENKCFEIVSKTELIFVATRRGGGLKGHSPEKKEKIGASLIDFHFYDIKMVMIFFNHNFSFDVMVSFQFELAVAN